jgi:hypothetical protein
VAGLGSSHWTAARRTDPFPRSFGAVVGMSHQATTFVMETWTDATRGEFAVGSVLAWRHHFEKRDCRISEVEIAGYTHTHRRTVERIVRGLIDRGRLKRPVKGGGAGGRVSSFVFVGFEVWIANRIVQTQRRSRGSCAPKYATSTPETRDNCDTSTLEYATFEPEIRDNCDTPIRKTGFTGERISGGKGQRPAPHRSSQFSQKDFDERDLRKVAEAWTYLQEHDSQGRPRGSGLSPRRLFEIVCERAGITIARGLQLEELQKRWPEKVPDWLKEPTDGQTEFNSKRPPEKVSA